jgi:hypothetical protein
MLNHKPLRQESRQTAGTVAGIRAFSQNAAMSDQDREVQTAILLGWGIKEIILAIATTAIGAIVWAFLF